MQIRAREVLDSGLRSVLTRCRVWKKYNKNHTVMYRRHRTIRSEASRSESADRRVWNGSVRRAMLLVAMIVFVSVAAYLFSVNRNAVAGYSMRVAEKRVAELSNESQRLRIREAELRSLYGLEEASRHLDMVPITDAVLVEESDSIAYRK